MRLLGRVGVVALGIALGLVAVSKVAQAQVTSANIGYLGESGFTDDLFTGSGSFIDTADSFNIDLDYTDNIDPIGNGQHGNTIIVTPIVDPVIYFNNLSLINNSGSTLLSVTFRLPTFSTPGQLGFVDPTALGLPATGFGSNAHAFTVTYIDPIGTYSGDYTAFTVPTSPVPIPLYSAIHFSQNLGTAEIADLGVGNFSLYGAFPAPTAPGALSFFMDISASATNGSTTPNAPGTPGPKIVVNVSAPEPATVALAGIGIIAGLLIARRRSC
jgi:hypothetical protein